MILSRRVALNGTQLDSLDNRIVIRSVVCGAPAENIQAVSRMGGAGQRITRRHTDTLDVTVRWAMDVQKYDMAARREILEKVNHWASACGWLTVNCYTGRRLWTEQAALPGGVDLWNWTEDYAITFRAYGVPYWQDATPVVSETDHIDVPGHYRTVCDIDIQNTSELTVNDLTVSVGNSQFNFENLGLDGGETLKIGHTNSGVLWIRIYYSETGYRDAFSKRTADSSDDMYAEPGSRSIDVTGGTATVRVCGRYA